MDYKLHRERENLVEADRLARRRDDDKRKADLEHERTRAAMRRQAEEDIQAERRRSDEHRAKLERENMRARALAEAEGRIKEGRENEDVLTRLTHVTAAEDRTTRLDVLGATFKLAGESLGAFIVDTPRVTATVVALTTLAAGVYVSREAARVAAAVVQKRLLTPALVRETSRSTGHFGLARLIMSTLGGAEPLGSLADVVLRADTGARVRELATSVANARTNGAPYRNVLFYGPPGTGKTMAAKRLARSVGMEYALMSGGDVGPLGRDAVTQLHALFDWAATSKRGVLLFIDEADAFLSSRSRAAMSEDQRNALNALLYRTGEASSKFMLVLATNRPGDLDAALTDRVDESLSFGLPDLTARRRLVRLYFLEYVKGAGAGARRGPFGMLPRHTARIPVGADVDDSVLDGVAERTLGFSGRAIAKLMLAVQGTAYGRVGGGGGPAVVDAKLVAEVLEWKLAEHAAKAAFATDVRFDFVAPQSHDEMR
jgi:ATPase family AAA domain-containing protein 3A/B